MKKLSIIFFISAFLILKSHAQKSTGLIFLDEDEYRDIPLASVAMMGTLPPHKDLASWFPSPGDQGQQSSCVGWAVAYGLKSYQEAVERRRRPTNSNHYGSPAFVYNQIKLSDCGGGSYITTALNFLKTDGTASLAEFPYTPFDCLTPPTNAVKQAAKNNRIADWRRVNITDDIEVKSQINSGFPVVIGMFVDQGFERLGYNEIYRGRSGQERGGHAMIVVGYDDSKQAYKVLNSWGTNWGTDGYGWVSYSAFRNRVKEGYTAQDIVINDPDAITDISENNNVNVPIPPPINPEATSVTAILGQPIIQHNQMVQTPIGFQPGMVITIPGNISAGRGSYAQLVLRFYQPNGQPLMANISETIYRDAHGLVATGTMRGPIIYDPAPLNNHSFSIPYYALNFQPTGGVMIYNVLAQATLYINEFEKQKSSMTTMTIRY